MHRKATLSNTRNRNISVQTSGATIGSLLDKTLGGSAKANFNNGKTTAGARTIVPIVTVIPVQNDR